MYCEYVVEPMVEKSVPIEKGRRRAASVGGRVAVKKKSKREEPQGWKRGKRERDRDRGGGARGVKGREK